MARERIVTSGKAYEPRMAWYISSSSGLRERICDIGIAAFDGLTTGRVQNLGLGGAIGRILIGEAREVGLAEWKPESTRVRGRRAGIVILRGSGHDLLAGRVSR
jgi:hypothetical protein